MPLFRTTVRFSPRTLFNYRRFAIVLGLFLIMYFLPQWITPLGAPEAHAAASCGQAWYEKLSWCNIKDKLVGGIAWVADATFGNIFLWIAKFFFWAAGLLVAISGWFLDFALVKTLDSAVFNNLKVIDIGWTLVRDLANMFFIFLLLYIAIETILGLMGHQTKTLLRNIIILALLINFSLFATKLVIDASNIIALAFYGNIRTDINDGGTMRTVYGPSAVLMEGLNLQTIEAGKNVKDPSFTAESNTGNTTEAFVYLGGTIIKIIASYVFVFGGILMLIRSIVFLFCMIFSPLAFLGMILPRMHEVTSKWWNALLSNAILAPVFMFMLYLDVMIIRNKDLLNWSGSQNAHFRQGLEGSTANWVIFYSFAVMIGLLIFTLTVSKSVAGSTASMATSWAKKGIGIAGGAAVGATAYGLRKTVGRASEKAKQSEKLQKMAQEKGLRGMLGRTMVRTANVGSKASFDARSGIAGKALGMTGISYGAAGGAGGFVGQRRQRDDKAMKRAAELFPNNPAAQDKYIQQHTKQFVVAGESRYDQKQGKYAEKEDRALSEKKETLAGEVAKEQNKKEFEEAQKVHQEQSKKLAELTKQKEDIEKRGNVAGAALITAIADTTKLVDDANKEGRTRMQRMSGEDVAKMLDKAENRADGSFVRSNLQAKDYSAINKRFLEGKYKDAMGNEDKKMMEGLTIEALKSDKVPEGTKRMVKNGIKNGTWGHEIDFKGELDKLVKDHGSLTDPALRSAKEEEIDEYWKMMDSEDRAELRDLLHEEVVASRLSGADLGVIGKKGNDGYYDDIPRFKERIDALHTRGMLGSARKTNTAAAHIEKSRGKKESFFYGSPSTSVGTAASSGWKIPAARMTDLSNKTNRRYVLEQKMAGLSLNDTEMNELKSLQTEIDGLSGDERSFTDDVRNKIS